mmetsp:Transcript_16175/g.61662  ORF Transcript_16175/g.61662 Transcript_16175/m.61662 type:complete len:194 (-) Transcript_16175:63-644(-)
MMRSLGQHGNTHSYPLHMLLYMIEGDTVGARFLYKRAPDTLKTPENDLEGLWLINKSLMRRDYEAAFAALGSSTWSEEVAQRMDALRESLRERVHSLLAKSYSAISLGTLSRSLGLSEDGCQQFAQDRGWSFTGDEASPVLTPPAKLGSFSGTDARTLQNIIRQCGALEAQVIRQDVFAKSSENTPAEEKKMD